MQILSTSIIRRATLVCSILSLGIWAQAEELDSIKHNYDLAELQVTATKRQTLKHALPSSISILGKRLLEQTQFQGIKDLGATAPNVHIPDFGSGLSTPIFIRGIGSRRLGMVGLYSDGVPLLENATIDGDYHDLRTIEILRGPQGTIYGRGAMGGIINMRSYRPLEEQFTQVNILGGQYGLYGINGQSYQRVSERLGFGASLGYLHRGGYHTNISTGEPADKLSNTSAKLSMQYRHNGWDIYGFAHYQYRDQGGYPYAVVAADGTLPEVEYGLPSYYQRKLLTTGLSIERQFDNGLLLKSGTSYQYLKDKMVMDQDFTVMPMISILQKSRKHLVTEELSISRSRGRYSWVTGVYGFYISSDKSVQNDIKMPPRMHSDILLTYDEPSYGLALYHQSSYQITERLTAELGLRYDWEHSRQTYGNTTRNLLNNQVTTRELPAKSSHQQFTPKASLSYRLGDEHRLYASVLRGYQPGGFNVQFDSPEEQSYKPEYSWNYELGTHLYFLNGRLQVDAAAYYIDWEQQQVQQAVIQQLGSKIMNAGRSRSVGAELALAYRPIEGLNLGASYGYTKATYQSYEEVVSKTVTLSHNGKYIPLVPKHTVSARADYAFATGLRWLEGIKLGVQYRGLGDIHWDNANAQRQAFYSLVDAQIGFSSGAFTLELWGRNLANTDYRAFQFASQGRQLAQRGTPRHFGGTLRIRL